MPSTKQISNLSELSGRSFNGASGESSSPPGRSYYDPGKSYPDSGKSYSSGINIPKDPSVK